MGDSRIEWTKLVWNATRGCSRVSEGCDNCWAIPQARRHDGPGGAYEGLTRIGKRGLDWSGRAILVPEKLVEPMRHRAPSKIFVNSMSDVAHESLKNEEIAAIFGVMALCPQHTFQILTKRPRRLLEWFRWATATGQQHSGRAPQGLLPQTTPEVAACVAAAVEASPKVQQMLKTNSVQWPLPNVWIGVSVENQQTADERCPQLLEVPAAVRWVSYEPALGEVDFRRWLPGGSALGPSLDWVVVGGESGHGARQFDVAWARRVLSDFAGAGKPVFVKQLGANALENGGPLPLNDSKGGDMDEWPPDVRIRQFPEVSYGPGTRQARPGAAPSFPSEASKRRRGS